VKAVANNLRRFQNVVRLPIAFETGVNYLQPRADEMPDGDYFSAVATAADCGILLGTIYGPTSAMGDSQLLKCLVIFRSIACGRST
jgi:hypothetical protein